LKVLHGLNVVIPNISHRIGNLAGTEGGNDIAHCIFNGASGDKVKLPPNLLGRDMIRALIL
jgi:hypothetical protein